MSMEMGEMGKISQGRKKKKKKKNSPSNLKIKKQNIVAGNVTNFQREAARENTPIPQEAIRRSCGNGALKR